MPAADGSFVPKRETGAPLETSGAKTPPTPPKKERVVPPTRSDDAATIRSKVLSKQIQGYHDSELARPSHPEGNPHRDDPYINSPPTTSGVFAHVKNVMTRISDWWTKRGSEPDETTEETERLKSGEMIRQLEELERRNRDLPTLLLSGKTWDGKTLSTKEKETLIGGWHKKSEGMADVESRPLKVHSVIEDRIYRMVERSFLIEGLVQSEELPSSELEDVEMTDALELLRQDIPKRIVALLMAQTEGGQRKIQRNDRQGEAREKLQALTRSVGGGTKQDISNRILRTYEAAARLPLMNMKEWPKEQLMQDYLKRLNTIERYLPVNKNLKQAMVFVRERLEETAKELAPQRPVQRAA